MAKEHWSPPTHPPTHTHTHTVTCNEKSRDSGWARSLLGEVEDQRRTECTIASMRCRVKSLYDRCEQWEGGGVCEKKGVSMSALNTGSTARRLV